MRSTSRLTSQPPIILLNNVCPLAQMLFLSQAEARSVPTNEARRRAAFSAGASASTSQGHDSCSKRW